jgi:hypothetical protein
LDDVKKRMDQFAARVKKLAPSHKAYVFEGFDKFDVLQEEISIPVASGEGEALAAISAVTNQSHWLAQLESRLAQVGEGGVASHASGSTGHSF